MFRQLPSADAFDQGVRQVQAADFSAFGFDVDRPGRVEGGNCLQQAGFKALLGGLRLAGQDAEHRALVAGQGFEVEDLPAQLADGLQDAGFGTAGRAA